MVLEVRFVPITVTQCLGCGASEAARNAVTTTHLYVYVIDMKEALLLFLFLTLSSLRINVVYGAKI